MQRYIYLCSSEIFRDSDGLLINHSVSLKLGHLIGLDGVDQLSGGILLAESGMGKSWFLEQLRSSLENRSVHLFKLGEYEDSAGLRADFEAKLTLSKDAIS
ncbi:MAG: hypothetical protein Q7U16_10410 [Agitococcus sp.]|nr:hypothetical protein [Agitococcus sp.]